MVSDAYEEGRNACVDGLFEEDNPYVYGSLDWDEWDQGYNDYLRGVCNYD